MTRQHALHQLLLLGPLTYRELLEITGWRVTVLDSALGWAARARGTVARCSGGRYRAKTAEEIAAIPPRARSGPTKWSRARREALRKQRAKRRQDGPGNWHEGPARQREPHPRSN
jgi:hypothetical protein